MITQFFLTQAGNVVTWFLSLWPAWSLPTWMATPTNGVATVLENASSMGVWVPWPLLVSVVGAVMAAYAVNLGVRAARWLLGLVPTMGGGS